MKKITEAKEQFLFSYYCKKKAKSMFIYFFLSISLLGFLYLWQSKVLEFNWISIFSLLFFSFGASEIFCRVIAYFIIYERASSTSGIDMYFIEKREKNKLDRLKEECDSLERVLNDRKFETGNEKLRKRLGKIKICICIKEAELRLFSY